MSNNIWWDFLSGPKNFKDEVYDYLIQEKNVIISTDKVIPYFDYLFENLYEQISEDNSSAVMYDYQEIGNSHALDVVHFILMKHQKDYGYRNMDAGLELLKKIELANREIIFINNVPKEKSGVFIKVMNYLSKQNIPIRLLVVFNDKINENQVSNNNVIIKYDDYVGEYDYLNYCRFYVSNKLDYCSVLKDYIAGLSIELFKKNITNVDNFLEDFSFNNNLNVNLTQEEIDNCLWKAQIKYIYPLLEEFRQQIIKDNYSMIENSKILPYEDSFENAIKKPEQIEYSGLVFYINQGRLKFSNEYEKLINDCHEIRNKLSHLQVVDNKTIYEVVTKITNYLK